MGCPIDQDRRDLQGHRVEILVRQEDTSLVAEGKACCQKQAGGLPGHHHDPIDQAVADRRRSCWVGGIVADHRALVEGRFGSEGVVRAVVVWSGPQDVSKEGFEARQYGVSSK